MPQAVLTSVMGSYNRRKLKELAISFAPLGLETAPIEVNSEARGHPNISHFYWGRSKMDAPTIT